MNAAARFYAGASMLAGICMAGAHAGEGNHALIIGIANYSSASGAGPLLGIPHDVVNARRMATAMGVDAKSIVELRDSQATKERILVELDALRKNVEAGDRVLVYFSGHGTRMETPSGCDEGLSTYTGEMITEAELAAYTQPMSFKADKLLVMVDACFSGGVFRPAARSLAGDNRMKAKFSGGASTGCVNPVNQLQSRSLLSELKRLGVHEENFVQIAAANFNEVSWDNQDFGGLATHAVSQCLLGEARDLNGSGAISIEELRACAQPRMDALMRPYLDRGMIPSTLQIKGNRNLVLAATSPTETESVAVPVQPEPVVVAPPVAPPVAPIAAPPVAPGVLAMPATPAAPPSPPPSSGPRATLEEIYNQRDPRRRVDVSSPSTLKIGAPLRFMVKSSTDGYLYALMLGSDEKSFYMVFPNKLDQDNRIRANQEYVFPRAGSRLGAGGPAGVDRVLFVVSQFPRDVQVFAPDGASAGGPYTFALTSLPSRRRVVDFFIGKGVKGRNAAIGAKLVEIEEVE